MMSCSCTSGSASRNDSISPALASASPRPAGLRSQTPISQTASTPDGVTASQAASVTVPRVTGAPADCASSVSQTAVLTS
jgi:hypothetical protein